MKVNVSNWKEFRVEDVFLCETTKAVDVRLQELGGTPYITRSKESNGCKGYYNSEDNLNKGNCITIGAEGGVAYYQNDDFIAGVKVYTLRSSRLNMHNALFLITVLNKLSYLYSYGRARVLEKIKNEMIKLPVDDSGNPDYLYMENYITSLNNRHITTKVAKEKKLISALTWTEFRLEDIFSFKKGKRLTKADMIDGSTNYLGAISDNNGVRQHIDVEKSQIYTANCITVNYNGSVGEAFYQSEPFWASDDVNVLYAKNWEMNKYNAMFIITVIKANKYRFSYGRKWTLEKMKESIIKLPISQPNVPNFDYMEQYIKKLSYSDRI
ncbi:restriction endonuclease subunit S [Chakrabartyella piscis]|uniref:restriction endonuclease subunit S n=1 Tax=Chakrabartyella piscis TaxID=2918914 RepID=UPI002958B1A7|nr:restriction endonuclease subunit S [Chakrabartyella piscis]